MAKNKTCVAINFLNSQFILRAVYMWHPSYVVIRTMILTVIMNLLVKWYYRNIIIMVLTEKLPTVYLYRHKYVSIYIAMCI